MAEDYWHAGRRFLVPLLLLLLFSVCASAQRTLSSSGKYIPFKGLHRVCRYYLRFRITFFLKLLYVLGCDKTFVSNDGPQNGTFRAPAVTNVDGESKVCVYTFVAASHQKVFVSFTSFNLRSTPPE